MATFIIQTRLIWGKQRTKTYEKFEKQGQWQHEALDSHAYSSACPLFWSNC